MVKTDIFLGAQWGDEGKGKVIDAVANSYQGVIRYQGGDNAGHTLYHHGKKLVLHLIPSGILHENLSCHLAANVVINPEALKAELEVLDSFKVDYRGRLTISPEAKIIFPFHKQLDQARESKVSGKIGTTGKGIGPAYEDVASRRSLNVEEFIQNNDYTEERLRALWEEKKNLLENYGAECISWNNLLEWRNKYQELLKPFLKSNKEYFNQYSSGAVLCEGAQGILLDLLQGTYPMVTSSLTGVAGCLASTGLSHKNIRHVYGISKAYTTRVGEGCFPSELKNEIGDKIQELGNEFGATTGRRRRCGWLDLVLLKRVIESQGMDYICLTKADIFQNFHTEIGLVTSYKGQSNYSGDLLNTSLYKMNTQVECFKPWTTTSLSDQNFLKFKDRIENYCGTKIAFIGTGPNREDLICLK